MRCWVWPVRGKEQEEKDKERKVKVLEFFICVCSLAYNWENDHWLVIEFSIFVFVIGSYLGHCHWLAKDEQRKRDDEVRNKVLPHGPMDAFIAFD